MADSSHFLTLPLQISHKIMVNHSGRLAKSIQIAYEMIGRALRLGINEKKKRCKKLFLFYVNINYRIFHVYNNLLLATSGVVGVVVKVAVPFPASITDDSEPKCAVAASAIKAADEL